MLLLSHMISTNAGILINYCPFIVPMVVYWVNVNIIFSHTLLLIKHQRYNKFVIQSYKLQAV